MTHDESLCAPLQRAVDATLAAQNPYAGWRYGIRDGDNDTSATGWALVTLDAARRAGIDVPDAALRHGLSWLDKATDSETGRVGFTGAHQHGTSFPGLNDEYAEHPTMTAIASLARDLLDRAAYWRAIGIALTHLVADLPQDTGAAPDAAAPIDPIDVIAPIDPFDPFDATAPSDLVARTRDYYYWHWASAAAYRANGPDGGAWTTWWPRACETILALQVRDGAERGS